MLRALHIVIVAVFLMSQCVGCEEVVDSTDIPYTPHIVVYGVLYGGDTLHPIRVTRTIPVSQRYEESDTWLSDADVRLTVDGHEVRLNYIDSGNYTLPNFPIETGTTYRLDISWKGLHTSGVTTVPMPAPIDTGRLDIVSDPYSASVVWLFTHVDNPVTLMGAFEQKHVLTAYDSLEMSLNPDYRPDTNWRSSAPDYGSVTRAIPGERDSVSFRIYSNPGEFVRFRAVLYTYDEGFYEFARTYSRYHDDESSFGLGGVNPKWNVDGDGIGIFTGVGVTKREVVLK